jgi:hypothetical protein
VRTYLCDTGPLLCFAQFPEGPGLFQARYADRIAVVTDVNTDLSGLRSHHELKVRRAATRAAGKAFNWIPRVRVDDPALLAEARDMRDVIDTFRKHPKGSCRRASEDWSDAVAIVYAAHQEDCVLIMNDSPARRAAKSRGVDSVCVVDVLDAMTADEVITGPQAGVWLAGMRPELDPGA